MSSSALRLALVIEFLVAVIAVFFVWDKVAGPDLLDLIPWHWKLILGTGLAFAIVQATASSARQENPWNTRTMGWLATALAFMILIGALTYSCALEEPVEEEETPAMSGVRRSL